MSAGALDGYRVVDWTVYHQGSAAAMLLAELGADVIHVEQRGQGDLMRGLSTVFGVSLILPSGRQTLFEDLNKNKRSLSLDLSKPKGREIMYRLVERSDVFLTNMRPKAVRKLGMHYDKLVELNPKLIFGQATSFGERGPEKDSPGLEIIAYARSGSMLGSGESGWPPTPITMGSGDRIGGIYMAFGAITALLARERTGKGQYFTTSQLGGMINLQAASVISTLLTGQDLRSNPRASARNPLYNWYKCADGRWIALGMIIESQAYWPLLCKAIDRTELKDDPRFKDNEQRTANCSELVGILDEAFAQKPCSEWEDILRRSGDMLFTRINSLADLASDPQVLENEYLVDFDHPVLGRMKHVALPITFSETPARIHSAAPEYGQHNEEILLGDLGLSWEEVEELREQDVI